MPGAPGRRRALREACSRRDKETDSYEVNLPCYCAYQPARNRPIRISPKASKASRSIPWNIAHPLDELLLASRF